MSYFSLRANFAIKICLNKKKKIFKSLRSLMSSVVFLHRSNFESKMNLSEAT